MSRRPTSAEAAAVLTIGQLAAHVGVTIRAVRHYHKVGLLDEPVRDASGYRRYGVQAVADLIRIKTLAEAGVPLGRVRELLDSDPDEFAEAVDEIDRALEQRIGDLERLRTELAGLMAGERLVLPMEVAALLDRMRSLGVSERTMTLERDGWTLLMAITPERVPEWARDKAAALDDPGFQRLYLAWEGAHDWDPDDPRLVELAAQAAAWIDKVPPTAPPPEGEAAVSAVHGLLSAQIATMSPAWRRLEELSGAHLPPAGEPSPPAPGGPHPA